MALRAPSSRCNGTKVPLWSSLLIRSYTADNQMNERSKNTTADVVDQYVPRQDHVPLGRTVFLSQKRPRRGLGGLVNLLIKYFSFFLIYIYIYYIPIYKSMILKGSSFNASFTMDSFPHCKPTPLLETSRSARPPECLRAFQCFLEAKLSSRREFDLAVKPRDAGLVHHDTTWPTVEVHVLSPAFLVSTQLQRIIRRA